MSADDQQHQALREMLGSYVLGHLIAEDAGAVMAHLDGCAACRAEYEEIAPLADRLATLDRDVFSSPASPPAGLGAAIRDTIAREDAARTDSELAAARGRHRTRRVSRLRVGLVAASVVLLVGVSGALVGRFTAPEAAPVPIEAIALEQTGELAVTIDSAALVNHTWGTELRIDASGFTAGETYRAAFLDSSGVWVPAGEFVGVGGAHMTCNLQSAALRAEITEVAILDAAGEMVVSADL